MDLGRRSSGWAGLAWLVALELVVSRFLGCGLSEFVFTFNLTPLSGLPGVSAAVLVDVKVQSSSGYTHSSPISMISLQRLHFSYAYSFEVFVNGH